jgi:hypothetical protein
MQHSGRARRQLHLVAVTPKPAGSRFETKQAKCELPISGHRESAPNFPELSQYLPLSSSQICRMRSNNAQSTWQPARPNSSYGKLTQPALHVA